jgi:hypothetical protein
MTISTNDNTYITLIICLQLFKANVRNPNSTKVPIGRNEEEQKDMLSLIMGQDGAK